MRLQVVPMPTLEQLSASKLKVGVYKIQASHTLPVINAKKTLKSVWLSPGLLLHVNRCIHHFGGAFVFLLAVAGPLSTTAHIFPARIGRWIALITTPLVLPAMIMTVLSLRYDLVVLLLGTFPFWQALLTTTIGSAFFIFYLGDARAVAVVSLLPGTIVMLLLDANFRGTRSLIAISFIGSVCCFVGSLFVVFSWIDDVHEYSIFRIYNREITAEAVIANGFSLTAIFWFHNAFVRRSFATSRSSQAVTTTVRCAVYRCRLRWQPTSDISRQSIERRPIKRAFSESLLQLRCSGVQQVIDAETTLVGVKTTSSFKPLHPVLKYTLTVSAIVGFVSMIATFAAVVRGHSPCSTRVLTLGIVSFTCTFPVCAFFVGFIHQVDMLGLLHANFDFIFNFGQLTLAHLCLCDLSNWDVRSLAVASSLLWLHWAIMVDAIPPIRRMQLGINVRKVSAGIQIAFLVAMVLFAMDLLGWHSQRFINRHAFRAFGYNTTASLNWSVGCFFLNRLPSLAAWFCRTVYRLATYDNDELIALRGRVEFDDYEAQKRQQRSLSSRTKIAQIISALSEQSQRSQSPAPPFSEAPSTQLQPESMTL